MASAVWHPEDRSMVVYACGRRRGSRWQADDGRDVIWSMETLREAHPFYNAYYKNISKAEQPASTR